jgi:hypothetical protein
MNKPKAITSGVILYFSSISLGLPSLLINAAYAPAGQSKPVIVIGGLLFLSLYSLLGYKINSGRNWARLTFAVLMILGLLMTFTIEPSGRHHQVVTYIFWVQTLLSSAALVLFFLPASTAWFRKTKTHA